MSKCRIALVSFDVNEGRAGLYPPLNLCVLATSLERAGYEVRAFDYAAPFSGIERYYREIRDYGPTMVGMACFTPYVALLHRISAGLRQAVPDAAFVMGGYHPTALPEWPLLHMPQFDYAMQGECDYAIVRLAEMLEGRRRPEAVPGLVYREGNEIRKNQREIVVDLDALPIARREYLDRYYSQGLYCYFTTSGKLDMMLTSRGCPFDCSFCFKIERSYRFRSTSSVMAEFDMLKGRGVCHIHIMDDAFTANKKRCNEIADELIRGRYRSG